MKTFCFICFILGAADCFGQQMQEFNQLYFEQEFKVKIRTALNSIKALPGARAAAAAAVIPLAPAAPVENTAALAEATAQENTSDENIDKVSVLPGFADILGSGVLLPKIEIAGVTNFHSETGFYADIRLFTSALSAKQISYSKVFFPETSTYGISMSFNYLPSWAKSIYYKANGDEKKANWLCTYFNLHYGSKNLFGINTDNAPRDTVKFTTSLSQLKLGIQIIPIKNILSFYADVNTLLALADRGQLKKYSPSLSNGFTNFLTVGTRFFLATTKDKPLNLFVDFNAAVMSHQLKKIYQSDDKIIPKISIGGAARF